LNTSYNIFKHLKHISTSLVVFSYRRLHIQWEITLINKDGRESVYKQTHTFFEDSSVTVYWNCGFWPNMSSLIGLQIHGMCPALPASRDK